MSILCKNDVFFCCSFNALLVMVYNRFVKNNRFCSISLLYNTINTQISNKHCYFNPIWFILMAVGWKTQVKLLINTMPSTPFLTFMFLWEGNHFLIRSFLYVFFFFMLGDPRHSIYNIVMVFYQFDWKFHLYYYFWWLHSEDPLAVGSVS